MIALAQYDRTVTDPRACLNESEAQVFDLIGQGWGARDISVDLLLHCRTVAHHFRSIRSKLGLSSQSELEGLAVKHHVLASLSLDADSRR